MSLHTMAIVGFSLTWDEFINHSPYGEAMSDGEHLIDLLEEAHGDRPHLEYTGDGWEKAGFEVPILKGSFNDVIYLIGTADECSHVFFLPTRELVPTWVRRNSPIEMCEFALTEGGYENDKVLDLIASPSPYLGTEIPKMLRFWLDHYGVVDQEAHALLRPRVARTWS